MTAARTAPRRACAAEPPRLRRLPLLLLTGGVSGLLLAPAPAATVPHGTPAPGKAAGATKPLDLLRRAAAAAERLSYHGVQLVSFWSATGTTSAVVDVTHQPGTGSLLRIDATPRNPARSVLHPDDGGGARTGTAVPDEEALALIAANYEAEIAGPEPVAGRLADVVVVRSRTGAPMTRFWLDRRTGLALRRESLDGAGRTVQESAFLSIELGPVTLPRASRVEPAAQEGRVTPAVVTQLARSGWQVPQTGAGLKLFAVRIAAHGRDAVVQLSYSDGMSTLSLFQQRGRLDTSDLRGWHRARVGGATVWTDEGVPRRVTWSSRGTVYTVVAEGSPQLLEDFVGALPRGGRRTGPVARLGRGVVRVGSWLNPFA